MSIRTQNFDDLIEIYFEDLEARKFFTEMVSGKSDGYRMLERISEAKNSGFIINECHDFFVSLNSLLDSLSVFELASMSGFVEDFRRDDFGEMLYIVLNRHPVRNYYEKFRPLVLPQLLRLRLDRNPEVQTYGLNEQNQASFFSFLELDKNFRENIGKSIFFKFLEFPGLYRRDVEETIEGISNKENFLKCLALESDGVTTDELKLLRIFEFYTDLQDCLASYSEYPLLQSAAWFRHGFLLQRNNQQLFNILFRALYCFRSWETSLGEEMEDHPLNFSIYIANSSNSLIGLCNRDYGSPMLSLLSRMRSAPEGALGEGMTVA